MDKTNSIFLYEVLVYDANKCHSFTVTNMISENHTTLSIFNWLAKLIHSDVPSPKEFVSDQSLALLSAAVQCFTQFSSLKDYIQSCSDLVTGIVPSDSYWLPRFFIRTDVAHFIKLVCKWAPLRLLAKRVREIIIRTIGLILKSQSLQEIRKILLSLFIVINNETDGDDMETGSMTPCERKKTKLIQAVSTGFVDFQGQFDEITNLESDNEDCPLLVHEYEVDNEGLESFGNPFQTWAENIYKESLTYVREGVGINAMFAPNLVPSILKCMKLVPLWSGLMIPIFGYGETISSSAAVESSFKKLKTVTFKHIDLPVNIEEFIENHVISLRGASLIRSSTNSYLSSASQQTHNITNDENIPIPSTVIHSSPILEYNDNYKSFIQSAENDEDFMEEPMDNECPLCSTGVFQQKREHIIV